MKIFKLILISIISFILLISCDTCQEVDCPYPFTDEELLWLPYSYNDKLIFIELNSNDSLIYRISYEESGKREPKRESAPYCITSCFYAKYITGDAKFSNGEKVSFDFRMIKTLSEFRLTLSYYFELADAIRLDSISVNNYYIKDVYKYICNPEEEKVAETYMHQGMGLVKIVFRDGQEFELVEHIKSDY